MARQTARREALAEAATDYALRQGLIGLSLRPLAASLGTSDRMLLYHFGDKHDLIATILRLSNDRSVVELGALSRSTNVRDAVLTLWRASSSGPLERCQRLYVEAAALGLFGEEPYASVVKDANVRWERALVDYLVQAGCPEGRAERAARVLDAGLMGFQLDLPLTRGTTGQDVAVGDLAEAVNAVASL